VAEPTAAPNPAPELRTAPERPTTENEEALELDAADLIEELEADDEALAETAEPTMPQPIDEKTPAVPVGILRPEPLTQEAALKVISETGRRSDIADAILGHAADIFEVATLLLVRDNMAFGWKGFGPGLDLDRIETLLVPLDTNSMFKAALGDERYYRAQAFPSNFHSHWFRILRTPAPDVSIVVICTIGKRIVNLLYGHTEGGGDLSDEKMDGLMDIMNAAARAYMRLISISKTTGSTPIIKAQASDDKAQASDDKAQASDAKAQAATEVDTDTIEVRDKPKRKPNENKTEEIEIIKVDNRTAQMKAITADDEANTETEKAADKTQEIEIVKAEGKTQEMEMVTADTKSKKSGKKRKKRK
jgi:hypothetical protein